MTIAKFEQVLLKGENLTVEFKTWIHAKDISEKVFQEALLNVLSHRDYLNMGAVYVKHYPDRIVIENPGAFSEGVNEKNIITHPSTPGNKLIAETIIHLLD